MTDKEKWRGVGDSATTKHIEREIIKKQLTTRHIERAMTQQGGSQPNPSSGSSQSSNDKK